MVMKVKGYMYPQMKKPVGMLNSIMSTQYFWSCVGAGDVYLQNIYMKIQNCAYCTKGAG
jgi:hypothetical protein